MSYSTRVYRQRNANMQEDTKKQSSFFGKANQPSSLQSGKPSFFQAKLSIGQPNDVYEKEADAVANRVVNNQKGNTMVQQKKITNIQRLSTSMEEEKLGTNDARMLKDKEIQEKPALQMECASCEKEEEKMDGAVQTKSEGGNTASPKLSSKIESAAGQGTALPAKTLQEMNTSFGVDFNKVNIHTDTEAVQMNKELNAQAFTHGSDIYFNANKFNPQTNGGKQLLAHELTHVVQQGSADKSNIQRSCSDGVCDSCTGGIKDFWVTFYFRRKATRATMTYLRTQINETKRILANCCLRLKASFNWSLMKGTAHFDPLENPGGNWQYTNDVKQLGTGGAFNDSRGIPVLVVDTVDDSGGGVTATQNQTFDPAYTGRTYAVIGVNQVNPNPQCNHLAHELWHVGSGEGHDISHGTLAACQGSNVSPEYCTGLRNIVAPVGDFPTPATNGNTRIA